MGNGRGSTTATATDAGTATPASLGDAVGRALCAERGSLQVLAEYLRPERLTPAAWAPLARDLARPVNPLRALRFFLPGPGLGAAWQEELDRLEVYLLVSQVGLLLGICADDDPLPPVPTLLDRAYELGPFPALWAVEGLGHEYAAVLLERGTLPDGWLRAPDLPPPSLLMLHAGLGLAVARRVVGRLRGTDPGAAAVDAAVAEMEDTCRRAGRPGYVGAALESLGLVTRTFYPWLVAAVGEAARRRADDGDGELEGYYWHGVGRALYFLPLRFLPCGEATWRAFLEAAETPPGVARPNAVAGVAWALTLVNQRHPAVLDDLLRRHGDELAALEGFTNGVASSLVMRRATTPDAPFNDLLCRRRPARPAPRWDELVRRPACLALEVLFPRLDRENRLDEVFRYHPLDELEGSA